MRSYFLLGIMLTGLSASAQLNCPDRKSDTTFYSGNRSQISTITHTCGDNMLVYTYSMEGILTQEARYLMLPGYDNSGKRKVLHGLQRVYHNNRLYSEKSYNSGVLCGREREFASNGMLIKEANYICIDSNGRVYPILHGKYLERDRQTLIKKSEGSYRRNQRHGKWKYYYPNGQLQSAQNYWCGFLRGREILYHANGQVIRKANWKLELKDKKIVSVYDGKFVEYASGSLHKLRKGRYKNGKMHGKWKEYHFNGQRKSVIKYRNGSYSGKYRMYYESGKPQIIARAYSDTAKTPYNPYGNTINYEGRFRRYAENGFLVMDYHYKNGKLNGKVQEFYSNGQLRSSAFYKNNLKDGPEHKYAFGRLIEMYTWKVIDTGKLAYHVMHGPFEINTAEGTTRGNYVLGRYHGQYLTTYADGRPKTIAYFDSGQNVKNTINFTTTGDTLDYTEYMTRGQGSWKTTVMHGRRFTKSLSQPVIRQEWIYNMNNVQDYTYVYDGKVYLRSMGIVGHATFSTQVKLVYYESGKLESFDISGHNGVQMKLSWYPGGQTKTIYYKIYDSLYESANFAFTSSNAVINGRYLGQLSYLMTDAEALKIAQLFPSADEFMQLFETGSDLKLNYKDGRPMIQIARQNGILHGTQYLFNPPADTMFVVNHQNGVLRGPAKFKLSRNNRFTGNYWNNNPSGHWNDYEGYYPENEHMYDTAGKLLWQQTNSTANGVKTSFRNYVTGEEFYWNDQGVLLSEKVLLNSVKREYNMRHFYPSGKLKSRGIIINYGYHGLYESFFENGNKMQVDSIKNGQKNGWSESYYEDGALHLKGQYLNNQPIGWWEKYDSRRNKSYLVYTGYNNFETLEHLPCACGDSSVKATQDSKLSSVIKSGEWDIALNPLRTLADFTRYERLGYSNLKESKNGSERQYELQIITDDNLGLNSGYYRYPQLSFNPCYVKGYESRIPLNLKIDKNKIYSGTIGTSKVAIVFDPNWLVFYDTIRKKHIVGHDGILLPFRQHFSVSGVSFESSKSVELKDAAYNNFCTDAWANVYGTDIRFQVRKAVPYWEAAISSVVVSMNKTLMEAAMYPQNNAGRGTERFSGLVCKDGVIDLDIYGRKQFKIEEMVLSNYRMDVLMSIPAVVGMDDRIHISQNGNELKLSLNELRNMIAAKVNGEVLISLSNGRALIYFNRTRNY